MALNLVGHVCVSPWQRKPQGPDYEFYVRSGGRHALDMHHILERALNTIYGIRSVDLQQGRSLPEKVHVWFFVNFLAVPRRPGFW